MKAIEEKFRPISFEEFKKKYQKTPVIEHPNLRFGKKPVVTVRILSYNHIDFIRPCLDSILKQKVDFDYEILIGEDESSDGTREVCIEYAKKHPKKIRLLLNSRKNNIAINGKPSGMFNSLYTNFSIRSKYIALCESDDIWQDEYSLQKRVDFMDSNPDFSFCFHNAVNHIYNPKKQSSLPKNKIVYRSKSGELGLDDVYTMIPTASILYRHHLIDTFVLGQEQISCGDLLLRHKLLCHGRAMYLHDIEPSTRIIHQGGNFTQLSRLHQSQITLKANEFVFRFLSEKGVKAPNVLAKIQLKRFKYSIYQSLSNKKPNLRTLGQIAKTLRFAVSNPRSFSNVLGRKIEFMYRKRG